MPAALKGHLPVSRCARPLRCRNHETSSAMPAHCSALTLFPLSQNRMKDARRSATETTESTALAAHRPVGSRKTDIDR
ncbi:hypothetical protein DAEQUDRAFT_119744 [Daedalea quercina L-15889]|uniref:Uncharacterized protein n=1 Tax=Daedalea quercina L-15889 TaxID=1314783 RepID=A0A165KRH8_9APHY|nr:hypothetical protein DAEQUDRAFT_119744 [Daedalea quercina L-15889]